MSCSPNSCLSPQLKLSLQKCGQKPANISYLHSNGSNNVTTMNKGKIHIKGKSNMRCRTLHCAIELEFQSLTQSVGENGGVGIDKFFQGKNIFITGAMGLVGKALVEKLLRTTSVGTIYLLVRAKDEEAAFARFKEEITESELFESLRNIYGSSYAAFVEEKLKPVLGNVCEPNLGMDSDHALTIMDNVDVIINSAANTVLNERYDVLLETNVNAPRRLIQFAKKCKNLKLFTHISTAYLNGRKEGLILEKPLAMGENGRKEERETLLSPSSRVDVDAEINLAMKMAKIHTDSDVTKEMKRLGMERAAFYGWQNTYQMSKAMGEMVVVSEMREDVPLLIIRPTVVESSYKEPFPGWIQGNRMFDPVIIAYGKGQLPVYLGDPQVHMDIVPVDMVANTTIAAISKQANDWIIKNQQLSVYHVATSHVNPLQFSEFFEYIYEYFTESPLNESESIARMKFFTDFDSFSKGLREEIFSRVNGNTDTFTTSERPTDQKLKKRREANIAFIEKLFKTYDFIGFMNCRYHTGNTKKLLEEMSEDEKMKFELDATKIDWRKYFTEFHIPGLRKHVLRDTKLGALTTSRC